MKNYSLPMPWVDFQDADRLVRAVLLQSAKGETPELRTATADKSLLETADRAYVEKNQENLGVCFFDHDGNFFDIWVHGAFVDTTNDWYRDTVLHELSHGYLKITKHSHRWRRFFGRVLYHYSEIVHPINAPYLTQHMLNRYTKRADGESMPKWLDRLDDEHASLVGLCSSEVSFISQTYRRLKEADASRLDTIRHG